MTGTNNSIEARRIDGFRRMTSAQKFALAGALTRARRSRRQQAAGARACPQIQAIHTRTAAKRTKPRKFVEVFS
jgi:hypothetical protein